MRNDMFFNLFLRKDAIRLLKKNGSKLDEIDSKDRENLIEMVMEDLYDKYSEEY